MLMVNKSVRKYVRGGGELSVIAQQGLLESPVNMDISTLDNCKKHGRYKQMQ